MQKAVLDPENQSHIHAKRIIEHNHFKVLYERYPAHHKININAAEAVHKAAISEFGAESVRYDRYTQKGGSQTFPVWRQGKILQSTDLSDTLAKVPVVATDFVFVDREQLNGAKRWLTDNLDDIIKPTGVID